MVFLEHTFILTLANLFSTLHTYKRNTVIWQVAQFFPPGGKHGLC